MYKLNPKLVKRSISLAKPYWFSEDKRKARWLTFLLMLLLVGDTQFQVLFNQQSGEFTSALAAQEGTRFWHSIRVYFGWLVVAVPIYSCYYYVRDTLALGWRRWLTEQFLDRYFRHRGFYKLLANPDIDNPDQRIADDIYSYTQQSLSLMLIFISAIFNLVAFGRVLWGISTSLVLFLFLYAAVGTAVSFGVFGERLVTLNFFQRRREADFRFGLVRIRENAEAIALYHGEKQEKGQLSKVFGRLFNNATKIIQWTFRLNLFQYSNSLLTSVLPALIIAPRVLSGELEVGKVVQATGAFGAILGSLTILVDNLDGLSRFAAGVGRLETLLHSLAPPKNAAGAEGKIITQEDENIAFDKVTLNTPNNERTLVKDLSFQVSPGEGLMIVGASGLGKSSLLRAMAGLWDSGGGTLRRPKAEDMLFLPQHPYMIVGTLRSQLNYPNLTRTVSDDELREVLELVNLSHLAERSGGLDADFEFDKILSTGERQRLAFARVILNHPRYVLLDEATSALDRENESALYERLVQSSTTLVSVSHHPALVQYHSQVLELKADGEWDLHKAEQFRFTEELV